MQEHQRRRLMVQHRGGEGEIKGEMMLACAQGHQHTAWGQGRRDGRSRRRSPLKGISKEGIKGRVAVRGCASEVQEGNGCTALPRHGRV